GPARQLHLLYAARPDDLVEHPLDGGGQFDCPALSSFTGLVRHRLSGAKAGGNAGLFRVGKHEARADQACAAPPRHCNRRGPARVAVLHLAQDELGWLSEPTMAYVGWRLDVPAVRVQEVVTFYTMYRRRPVGRHHIGVCNSVSCWALGSEKILEHCADRLGI